MAEEQESAHGKLSTVDQAWTANRFLALFAGTLVVALIVIYVISSIKSGDFTWYPFANDLFRHPF